MGLSRISNYRRGKKLSRKTSRHAKRRAPSESQIQIDLVNFLEKTIHKDVEWTAFPAGGGGLRRGALLKRMGLKPGWPDLIFVRKDLSEFDHGTLRLYGLELKKDNASKLSDNQKLRHARLKDCGAEIGTAYTLDQAVAILKDWGLLRC